MLGGHGKVCRTVTSFVFFFFFLLFLSMGSSEKATKVTFAIFATPIIQFILGGYLHKNNGYPVH